MRDYFKLFCFKSTVNFKVINCTNNLKSKLSLSISSRSFGAFIKMKRKCSTPSKHSRFCAEHFSKDCFQQNIAERSFWDPLLSLVDEEKGRGCDDFLLHYGTLQAGKRRRNQLKTLAEQLVNSSTIFPGEIRFAFRFRIFPTNDSLTHKHGTVQDNSDVTK